MIAGLAEGKTILKKVSFDENKMFSKSKVEKFIKYHSKQLYKSWNSDNN